MNEHPLKIWRGKRPQGEAGKLLGVNAMTYSRWERGVHLPRKQQWPTIERVAGIPAAKLVEYVKASEPAQ